jgi:transketolase
VNDRFGESGTPEDLMKKYGLTAEKIAESAERAISRKI